ncbi:unnamed protein product [Leptidea sinapis]|uniref:Uncharacterized protein n=2 Tax=Leptidea sinapis TaxID=189913 RepID=A0A5E4PU90_9NEOP|nr:unnamed protein product [Leptidea sinapis]
MVANRRNLIFRVSIVINIAVLLYAAMHLSANTAPGVVWVPLTVDGSERSAEYRYFNRDDRNETETRPGDSSARSFEESTSQKTPSTMATTNKTASSTASIPEIEKKSISAAPEAEASNATLLEIDDEDSLSPTTQAYLRTLLGCNDKDMLPHTEQRGEFWVLKNYIRGDHGMISCHESVTYTTHAGYEFLDNVQPLVER